MVKHITTEKEAEVYLNSQAMTSIMTNLAIQFSDSYESGKLDKKANYAFVAGIFEYRGNYFFVKANVNQNHLPAIDIGLYDMHISNDSNEIMDMLLDFYNDKKNDYQNLNISKV